MPHTCHWLRMRVHVASEGPHTDATSMSRARVVGGRRSSTASALVIFSLGVSASTRARLAAQSQLSSAQPVFFAAARIGPALNWQIGSKAGDSSLHPPWTLPCNGWVANRLSWQVELLGSWEESFTWPIGLGLGAELAADIRPGRLSWPSPLTAGACILSRLPGACLALHSCFLGYLCMSQQQLREEATDCGKKPTFFWLTRPAVFMPQLSRLQACDSILLGQPMLNGVPCTLVLAKRFATELASRVKFDLQVQVAQYLHVCLVV